MHPQLYRRKPGGPISARYTDENGVRQRESTRCTDEKAALAWLRNKEREIHDPIYQARKAQKITVSEAVDFFMINGIEKRSASTVEIYRTKTGHLNRLLRDDDNSPSWSLSSVDESKMDRYIKQRTSEGAHPHTIKKELNVFRRLIKVCAKGQLFVGDPKKIIPEWSAEYVPNTRWLSRDEFWKMFAELDSVETRNTIPGLNRKAWVMVCLFTAFRLKEVNELRWWQVDFQKNSVDTSHCTKTKKSADGPIPLARPLRDFLLPLRGDKDARVVGAPWLSPYACMRLACERAGIDYTTSNDLRRTYASWLLQAGVSSFIVAKLMRHSTTHMVETVYGKLDLKTMRDAQKLIDIETKLD